jgi:hypothetical protein
MTRLDVTPIVSSTQVTLTAQPLRCRRRSTPTTTDFTGVDMVDGAPLLDIKPWVAPLDVPNHQPLAELRNGWFDEADLTAAHTPNALAAVRTQPRPSPARSDP